MWAQRRPQARGLSWGAAARAWHQGDPGLRQRPCFSEAKGPEDVTAASHGPSGALATGWFAGRRAPVRPLDHGPGRAVQEDEPGRQLLLQLQLAQLADQEDGSAEPEHAAHVGRLVVHDGPGDTEEVLVDELGRDHHQRHVEPDEAGWGAAVSATVPGEQSQPPTQPGWIGARVLAAHGPRGLL